MQMLVLRHRRTTIATLDTQLQCENHPNLVDSKDVNPLYELNLLRIISPTKPNQDNLPGHYK